MQNFLGRVRRCVDDYHMIDAGDSIAVGVSGGKDSLTLLAVLAGLRRFYPKAFSLRAITIDMGLEGMDFSPVADFCRSIDVPYTIKRPRSARSSSTTGRKRTPAPCARRCAAGR